MLLVKKYGGSSVATPEKILNIAKLLKHQHDQGHKLIVIVSAMGDTTDDLIDLSRKITLTPNQREMDMLLSSGERISMALVAMALNSLGCEAISFTGSQSGVFTDGHHSNARITDIKPIRVQEALDQNKIVIIAGFQGVDPKTKEVTTLGRGGSDTTAVALAAHFKANRCDILTDVRGLYSIDPRVPGVAPKHFSDLDYDTALEMAYWGARVLHYRSVELAKKYNIPVLVHLSSEEGSGTLITGMEKSKVLAINYISPIGCLSFDKNQSLRDSIKAFFESLNNDKQPLPQILYQRENPHGHEIFFTAPLENFENLHQSISHWCEGNKFKKPSLNKEFGCVSLTGQSLVNSSVIHEAQEKLAEQNIESIALITSPQTVSFVVHAAEVQKTTQALHNHFIN